MKLIWGITDSYLVPARTECERYIVVRRVGGSRGPLYQAQHIAGVGIATDLGEAQALLEDAQDECQAHADRQREAA